MDRRLNGLNPLSYLGENPYTPSEFLVENRPPLATDAENVYLGSFWMVENVTLPTNQNLYYLAALKKGIATWILLSVGSGDLFELTSNIGGPVLPLAGNINVVGDGVGITGVGNPATNTITFSLVGAAGPAIATLTGNAGGAVSPLAGNINVIGDGIGITGVGNPATNTITFSLVGGGGQAIQSLQPDVGLAVNPIAGLIALHNIDTNIVTSNGTLNANPANFLNFRLANNIVIQNNITSVLGDITITQGNLALPSTTSSVSGVINQNGNRFIHSFGATGVNTFVGRSAGNFTLTGTANTGIGFISLSALTTGIKNACFGSQTGTAINTGSNNTIVGHFAANGLTTGSDNVIIGQIAGDTIITGINNVIIGSAAGNAYTGAESKI